MQGSNAFASAGAAAPDAASGLLCACYYDTSGDSSIFEYGDTIRYGGSTAVAAVGGAVHPLWIDTSDPGGRRQEVFAATLR